MKVPLTIVDHLERAEVVYGPRTVLLDEPDQPAASWGGITAAEMAARARAQAAALDDLGVAQGERVAIVSHNSARLLTAFWGVSAYGRVLVPINFRLSAEEIRYIVGHSGASMLLVDPELDEQLADGRCAASPRPRRRERRGALPRRRRAGAVVGRRGRDRDDQLHERHDGASEGRPAHAPQPLGELGDLRAAPGGQRPRRVPAHVADVPLQRLGHDVRHHRDGCAARRAPQDRRRRDPAPGGRVTASRSCAVRPQW